MTVAAFSYILIRWLNYRTTCEPFDDRVVTRVQPIVAQHERALYQNSPSHLSVDGWRQQL